MLLWDVLGVGAPGNGCKVSWGGTVQGGGDIGWVTRGDVVAGLWGGATLGAGVDIALTAGDGVGHVVVSVGGEARCSGGVTGGAVGVVDHLAKRFRIALMVWSWESRTVAGASAMAEERKLIAWRRRSS